ncbi:stAR-related lipid transfer protein 5-like [Amphiura filiformis]|uniref:stAR-related lipid transfer protein 5-like n=1 Tax=Amphiura filiformis TaxID=82378 RepID=UPI003B217DE7
MADEEDPNQHLPSASERRADLLNKMDEISQKAMELLQDDSDDWETYSDKPCEEMGIKITHKPSEEFGGKVYRMDFTVDRPIEDIIPLTVLIPPFHQLRHMWNPGFEESDEIVQLDHDTFVLHVSFQPLLGGIVSSRDFCLLERVKCIASEGSVFTCCGSAQHPACEASTAKVRGEYFPSMWFLKPVDGTPEKTSVVRISQWDPKIPVMPWFVQNNHCLKWYASRTIDFKKCAESIPPEDIKKLTKDVTFYEAVIKDLETPM